ncbi:Ankyrin repeat domain-containing protein 17, partial [Hondaea fermentalgiana]
LQSADPSKRPTALEALRHEAFQVKPVKQASCAICLDIYPISEGVICADDHFTCKECLSRSVRAATQPNAHVNVLRDGSMCCVTPDCELLISGRTIASAVPEEDFAVLLDIVRAHFERDAAVEQERQLQLRLDAALREHGLDPTTQNHIRTIQNEVLTMSCPRCAAAFADFAGCCALEMASVLYLIENGDFVGVQRAVQADPALLDAAVTADKRTPLLCALDPSSGGQPAIAQWLVEQGAKLDLQDVKGWTALMIACSDGQPDTAQMIIQRGAKLDLQNNEGRTALMIACSYDQPDTVQMLIQRGAKLDLQDKEGSTALMFACCHDQPDTARLLIQRDAKFDLQDKEGWTALMFACRYDQPDTAQLLIEHDAKLDLQDKEGWTALMLACCYDQPAIARLLIARVAKLNLQNNGGCTALMVACQQPSEAHHTASGLLRCIKLCYGSGADLELKNKNGNDALAVAKDENRADAVAFLEFVTIAEVVRGVQELQAVLDRAQIVYEMSQTPLMRACKNGDIARAKKLVADGAPIDARDRFDLTPMIYACKFNEDGDDLSLAKLLFEHSAGLSSDSLGIEMALAQVSSESRMELYTFLSFIHSLPLEHFHRNELRVMVVKLFDEGVRTLGDAHNLTSARLEQLGISSAPDRRELLMLFAISGQTINLEALAQKISLARTKCKEGKPILHPSLTEFLAEQLLRKDPVASLADFDEQHTNLREKEQELIALQEAVKTNSKKVSKRNKTRRDLVKGIRDALSGGIEGQLEKALADPGTKAVVDSCRSLWKEILKESAVVDDTVAPATFDQVQEATRDAVEAVKAWEARHDTSAACERTEAAIDALEESTKRLGIQATFFMTLRHPEKTRHVAMELQNVQQALKAELKILTNVDPMADAPLLEVRRALASTISFYTCALKNEVSRLQKAAKDLSSSLSRHVPGLSAPDTSQVMETMKKVRQNKRKREDLERDLERIREDANDGDAKAQAKIPGLEQELAQLEIVYKLDSELRKKRARVLRHAEEHNPELLQDQKWIRSLGVNNSVPRELSTLGLWLTNAKRKDFEIISELASKPGKSVLKVRDLNGREFVLKSFHLANEEWSSRFYR